MSSRTIQVIKNADLGISSFLKMQKVAESHGIKSVDGIIFSDEKLFCTEKSYKF